jgi:urease accessory protein
VHATARIVVEAGPGGGNRFVALTGTGPITPRRTGPERVHLVAGAGGPLGGDDYTLEVVVGAGARLSVCSAAASIVLAADGHARPDRPSRLTVRARVEAGGELRLTPQAVLLTRRGRHECVTSFDVAAGGRLLARELLVLGRSGEQGGHGEFRTSLDVDGRPVLRQTVRFTEDGTDGGVDDGAGTAGPAVLAGGRALGQILLAGASDVPAGVRGPRGAWLPSAEPGCGVFTVTDPESLEASRALDRETAALDRGTAAA